MPDEFKTRLVKHAENVVGRADRALTEAATQQYLILPFLQVLGYDPLNPDEVIPEAHASFSDKFKNRVDYAICIGGEPAIAIECKCAGKLKEANKGELKGYFNAMHPVKLGILTDGLTYQLYSDTARENMMDDDPFVSVDLAEVAKGRITDNALDALAKLRKGTFDPADVGADAKRKIYIGSYIAALEANIKSPSEPFVRTMADLARVEGRRTSRLIEEHEAILAEAFQAFLDKKILERVGFAEREDLVKMQSTAAATAVAPPIETAPDDDEPDGVITTDTEMEVFDYVRSRLSFLSEDERMFGEVGNVASIDRKTVFIVYYKQERKGRLFNFREGTDPKYRFEFPDLDETIETDHLKEIDQPLFEMFSRRVAEFA